MKHVKIFSCPSCGVVHDYVALKSNNHDKTGLNEVHMIDGEDWFQCRSCAKRFKVNYVCIEVAECKLYP